ncbi:group III truncated hemoglobin [Flavihumibacter profundi]|jgi:hemoglobin|uniref:group III truncated hemoglobin n=1 Tax=Flavihumibacter profundi TaxID=2716883 RepID=UPI001CC71141|nr:group III truncated hemoglobin [Flavihumibacter profundi]MBZ5857110.1 group III truncated hemoglobin [Flavihumibacter profundi]
MDKKHDIRNRADIESLITRFYDYVQVDPVIGHFFTEVVKVNFQKHLPVMFDFWENILFYSGNYNGNPMAVHKHLHSLHPLTKEDFEHWLKLFKATAHEHFEGPNTELIIQRAMSIATTMEIKLLHPSSFS